MIFSIVLIQNNLRAQNFHGSDKVFTECCSDDNYIVYEYDMKYINGTECGNWTFSSNFEIVSPDGCIDLVHDVKWSEQATNHEIKGENVNFYISTTHAVITLHFEVHVNGNNCPYAEYFDIQIPISQPNDCPGCVSRINYCETFPCSAYSFPEEYSHDLVWVKMIDADGNCFDINENNNFGIFNFPYVLHTPPGCDFNLPNLYDFVNDLNTFLNPINGHVGHAFVNHYNASGECKIKIEIVSSDMTMDKWICKGYNVKKEINDCTRWKMCGYARPLSEYKSCYTTPDYCRLNGQFVNEDNWNETNDVVKPELKFELNDIIIYPNVVSNILNIELPSQKPDGYLVYIYNIAGEKIKELKVDEKINHLEIKVSGFEPGLYFIGFYSNFDSGKIIKFIKQ